MRRERSKPEERELVESVDPVAVLAKRREAKRSRWKAREETG